MYDENGKPIPEDPWSSIVDLMSALVLVLFLAVIFFVTNLSEASSALESERAVMAEKSVILSDTQNKLATANAQNLDLIAREERLLSDKKALESKAALLLADQARLIKEQEKLKAEQLALLQERSELKAQKDQLLGDKSKLLGDKNKLLGDKNKLLGDKNKLLGDKAALTNKTQALNAQVLKLQAAIKEAAAQRTSLMNQLESTFNQKSTQGVSLDKEGGKIILKSEVLFPVGQAELTTEGKKNLGKISAALIEVLKESEFRAQVEGIMIEGHTSQAGPFRKNLELSAQRSMHTLQFLLSLPQLKKSDVQLKRLFFAGAFGESRPILKKNGQEDEVKSRRIEIRLLFNQAHIKGLTDALSK